MKSSQNLHQCLRKKHLFVGLYLNIVSSFVVKPSRGLKVGGWAGALDWISFGLVFRMLLRRILLVKFPFWHVFL